MLSSDHIEWQLTRRWHRSFFKNFFFPLRDLLGAARIYDHPRFLLGHSLAVLVPIIPISTNYLCLSVILFSHRNNTIRIKLSTFVSHLDRHPGLVASDPTSYPHTAYVKCSGIFIPPFPTLPTPIQLWFYLSNIRGVIWSSLTRWQWTVRKW